MVFGPDDVLFNRLAKVAALAPFMPVVGNGRARVQPVFVGDVAAAAVAVLVRPDTAKKRVLELGGPRASTPIASWPRSPCARSTAASRSSVCRRL